MRQKFGRSRSNIYKKKEGGGGETSELEYILVSWEEGEGQEIFLNIFLMAVDRGGGKRKKSSTSKLAWVNTKVNLMLATKGRKESEQNARTYQKDNR